MQVHQSSSQHTPSAEEWGTSVHSLLGQLDARHGADPASLNAGESALAQREYAEGGQGSLDDLLEALDGGLQVCQ